MRLVSLLVLIALVGGAAYVWFFQRDWLFQKADEAKRLAQGYTAAKTPSAAVDNFTKAINKRDYEAAAIYCSADYAELLKKAHKAAQALGEAIDSVTGAMDRHNIDSPNSQFVLSLLDPFPTSLKVVSVEKQGDESKKGDKKGKDKHKSDKKGEDAGQSEEKGENLAIGVFSLGLPPAPRADLGKDWGLDPRMIRTLSQQFPLTVEVRAEGKEDKVWKIQIPKLTVTVQRLTIDHLIGNYKNYVRGLQGLRRDALRDAGTKAEFERELKKMLSESK
jgi:hypothetical protein